MKPIDILRDTFSRDAYGTCYTFNSIVAPNYTREISARFRYVETAMSGAKTRKDSHGATYNHHKLGMMVGSKDNPDRAVTIAFMEQVDKDLEGKSEFLSWKITPRMTFEETRVGEKQFKMFTLEAAFTCR